VLFRSFQPFPFYSGYSAFCDVMLAVKEVGGVARIKRKWLEPGKGPEDCARPLPTIAQQVGHTEGAGAGGIRPHGDRIPALEVKVPEALVWRFVSPRVRAFQTVSCAIGGAMQLGFGGQRFALPAGVGQSLGVADVHGPIDRQRQLGKHGLVKPLIAAALPKSRVIDSPCLLPLPIGVGPEGAMLVSSGALEVQVVRVGHVVGVDGEGGDVHAMRLKLVVPTEGVPPKGPSKRRLGVTW